VTIKRTATSISSWTLRLAETLLDVIAFEQDVQRLLGRNVDVLTVRGLSPYLQHRILAEAASL